MMPLITHPNQFPLLSMPSIRHPNTNIANKCVSGPVPAYIYRGSNTYIYMRGALMLNAYIGYPKNIDGALILRCIGGDTNHMYTYIYIHIYIC